MRHIKLISILIFMVIALNNMRCATLRFYHVQSFFLSKSIHKLKILVLFSCDHFMYFLYTEVRGTLIAYMAQWTDYSFYSDMLLLKILMHFTVFFYNFIPSNFFSSPYTLMNGNNIYWINSIWKCKRKIVQIIVQFHRPQIYRKHFYENASHSYRILLLLFVVVQINCS